jgi:hypothetical protein
VFTPNPACGYLFKGEGDLGLLLQMASPTGFVKRWSHDFQGLRPDRHDRQPRAVHSPCMRRVRFLVFLAIATGCQYSENRYLARTVRSEELVGSWRATEFAIKSLRDVGVASHLAVHEHTLVLRADGSCSIRTIMNMPVSGAADYRTYDTGCRWRLGEVGHQALQFDLTPTPGAGTPYYYFGEEDGRLLLWQYATDPDAWRYMEFEKSPL